MLFSVLLTQTVVNALQLHKACYLIRAARMFILYNSSVLFFSSNSDDNLLKNIELFDKLCIRFSSRIKFMKDIVGRGEICCWAFYGHERKVAEVCCESIVYATDRKHTKIEFPEAKILEETLNIMLYEKKGEEAGGVARTAHIDPTSRTRRNRTPEGFLSEDQQPPQLPQHLQLVNHQPSQSQIQQQQQQPPSQQQ